jgi:hypothetical protein
VPAVPRPAVGGRYQAGCLAVAGAPGGGRRAWAAGSAAVIPGLGALAAVIAGLGVLAAVIPGLGVAALVVPGLGVAAVIVKGARARRDLDRNALRKRRIAHQAGDAGHGCYCRHRRGDQQLLHGFFLPWIRFR